MNRLLKSALYRSLSQGRAVEIWEDNWVVEGWVIYAIVTFDQDEVTILAEVRVRDDKIQQRVVDESSGHVWVAIE